MTPQSVLDSRGISPSHAALFRERARVDLSMATSSSGRAEICFDAAAFYVRVRQWEDAHQEMEAAFRHLAFARRCRAAARESALLAVRGVYMESWQRLRRELADKRRALRSRDASRP